MSLEFQTTLDKSKFDATLKQMKAELADVGMALGMVGQVVGVYLGSTAKMAIDMIQMSSIAVRHLTTMYATHPALLPIGILFYAQTIAMQMQAIQEVYAKQTESMAELSRMQMMTELAIRYGG